MFFTIDENIAFAADLFSELGKVQLLPGRKISRDSLLHTDALIVRSVTNVDADLLRGTPVKFVGTATIGTDHIDKEYLSSAGIGFADAKGCNADAVVEYVLTAVFRLMRQRRFEPRNMSVGIIGCGNIGGRLSRILHALGFNVLKNDPPLQRAGAEGFVSLDEALNCNIITVHTPLNKTGQDKTFHLLGYAEFEKAENLEIFINASRGEVVDGSALLAAKRNRPFLTTLDVWESEPYIDPELLHAVQYASPHIAGYTYEGKVNGTRMMYDAVTRFFEIADKFPPAAELLSLLIEPVHNPEIIVSSNQPFVDFLDNILRIIYDIKHDTDELKSAIDMTEDARGSHFDSMRKLYHLRREFNNFTIKLSPPNELYERMLKALRFNVHD